MGVSTLSLLWGKGVEYGQFAVPSEEGSMHTSPSQWAAWNERLGVWPRYLLGEEVSEGF